MTRVLRGAWSRRGALLSLVAMTVVVVGGAVASVRFADAAGTSATLAAPLLLLGAVAVPSIGSELAVARREEIGLARLRGIHGLRLWSFLLVEPLLAIVVGLAIGLAVGAGVAVLATRTWLGEGAEPLDGTAVLVAAAVAGAGLVIVGLGAAAGLREPLAAQVATRHRPRRATTLTIFLTVLVVVGAAVAAYRSGEAPTDDPDLLVLLGPALLGLAMGQVGIGLVRLVARIGTGATASRGLGAFLTTRRLARADDLVTPIRLVVAASVVGTLALTGSAAVDRWSEDQARIEIAGPQVIDADLGATGAWQLTRDLDPEGAYLMASVLVPSESRLPERRGYVDAGRWDTVVGDFLGGTPAAASSAAVPDLAADAVDPPAFAGDTLTVSSTALVKAPVRTSRRFGGQVLTGSTGIVVTVDFVARDGVAASTVVELDLPESGSRDTGTARVRGCRAGCLVTRVSVGRVLATAGFVGFDTSPFEVRLDDLRVGDRDLLDYAWLPDESAIAASRANRFGAGANLPDRLVVNTPDGLLVRLLPDRDLPLLLEDASAPLPVLVAGDPDAVETALDPASEERPAQVVAAADVLPIVGTAGTLADLPSAAVGSGPSVPSSVVRVVAADATPGALLDRVADRVGGTWRPLDDVRQDLAEAHGGPQSVAYVLTAIPCALVALLALAAGVARHRRDYRRDMAALRVLGIGLATARRAGRTELALIGAVVVSVVAVGGWLAVTLLLGGLPLLDLPVASLPLDLSPTVLGLLVPCALAALAVVLIGGRARRVAASTTRPSILREEEGR